MVVAADVDRAGLYLAQFAPDGVLLGGEALGERPEAFGELGIIGLLGEFPRPIQRQVEVAAVVSISPTLRFGERSSSSTLSVARSRGASEELRARVAGLCGEQLE